MNLIRNSYTLILVILLGCLLLRVTYLGGINKSESGSSEPEATAAYFYPVRDYLSSKIDTALPSPQASLLTGMLIGEKSSLPAEFRKALTTTSTIHIVVVSGQNLTLVAGFILRLSPLLGRRKTIVFSIILVILYSFLTGLQIPVIRAAIMFGIASIATFFGREKEGWWVLGLAVLLMFIINPSWIYSISFQLSVLATIGVVMLAPEVDKLLRFIPDLLRQDLSVSLSAQLLTLPIIAINFHQVSLIGLLVNSLILFTVAPIMISGAISLALSLVAPLGCNNYLCQIIFIVPDILLSYFVYIVEIFSKVPSASTYIRSYPIFFWLGYYILCFGGFIAIRKYNLSHQPNDEEKTKTNVAWKYGM